MTSFDFSKSLKKLLSTHGLDKCTASLEVENLDTESLSDLRLDALETKEIFLTEADPRGTRCQSLNWRFCCSWSSGPLWPLMKEGLPIAIYTESAEVSTSPPVAECEAQCRKT